MLLALVGLLGVGMLLSVVMMVVSVPEQSSLFDALDPGIVGGIVLTLVQLALLPLLAVWALVVLLGGTVGVGTSSSISLDGSATGVMPALPLLGAFPGPGDFSAWLWLLLVVPAVPVVVGALRLVRDVEDTGAARPDHGVTDRLSRGGGGRRAAARGAVDRWHRESLMLVHLGPQMSSLILPLLGVVVVSTGVVLVALASPVVPWVRAQTAALRARVESAESAEGSEDAEFSGRSGRERRRGARGRGGRRHRR